jgi:hypothetical protein
MRGCLHEARNVALRARKHSHLDPCLTPMGYKNDASLGLHVRARSPASALSPLPFRNPSVSGLRSLVRHSPDIMP